MFPAARPATDVLTLRLDDQLQAHFDRLRTMYFPPERNLIAAHLTLFHTLPEADWVREALMTAGAETGRFEVHATGLRSLGKGVAFILAAPELMGLHGRLARAFAGELTAQDRQKFQPHVVVQNKVTAEAARELLDTLRAGFRPLSGMAVGLDLWRYLGGPWEHRDRFWFAEG